MPLVPHSRGIECLAPASDAFPGHSISAGVSGFSCSANLLWSSSRLHAGFRIVCSDSGWTARRYRSPSDRREQARIRAPSLSRTRHRSPLMPVFFLEVGDGVFAINPTSCRSSTRQQLGAPTQRQTGLGSGQCPTGYFCIETLCRLL